MATQKSPTPMNGSQTLSPVLDNPKSPITCSGDTKFNPTNISINKQISKLKRFLSTLLSFGSDIDSNTGEVVRSLVFALLCNKISVEQFQTKLQEATHFPLKAFVTPFLKATLPMLRQEIILCSQLVHQSPENFLLHNKEYLNIIDANTNDNNLDNAKQFCLDFSYKDSKEIDLTISPEIPNDILKDLSTKKVNNKNILKRSISMKIDSDSGDFKAKDLIFSPTISSTIGSWKPSLIQVSNFSDRIDKESLPQHCTNLSPSTLSWPGSISNNSFFDSITSAKHKSFTDKLHHHWDQLLAHISNFQAPLPNRTGTFQFSTSDYEIITGFDDIMKYQEEYHKNIIQQLKVMQENVRRHKEDNKFSELLHGNISTGSHDIAIIRRRAAKYYDDAVQEVQRVAQIELKRTIRSLQEQTMELLEQEKVRFQYVIEDIKRQYKEEYAKLSFRQDEGIENCQNCGRKAAEACSGCQIARYCGRFCQQKDWNRHKNECGHSSISACKIGKFDNFDVISTSSKSPTQNDPENLSLKGYHQLTPDLSNYSKSSQHKMSSDLSITPLTYQYHKPNADLISSEDTVLIDI